MAKMALNIYDRKTIVKTYEADTYDMMFGTLEDLLKLAENASDEQAVLKQMGIFRPFMKEIFPDVTDEELRQVRVKDVFNIMQEALAFAMTEISSSGDTKNA